MLDLTTKSSAELATLLRTIPVSEWNAAVVEAHKKDAWWRADLSSANLSSANLRFADLRYADLHSANLRYADLRFADLRYANLRFANLSYADLHSADLSSANLSYANLSSANLSSANLHSANIDGRPLTIDQWCDIFDMPTIGKGLRVGFKRIPNDRITGRKYNNGEHLIEWQSNKWIEAPDWNDAENCGGGLHLSPTAAMTRYYSSEPLCIAVAFDPKDAVMIGDKLKVRRCKVL